MKRMWELKKVFSMFVEVEVVAEIAVFHIPALLHRQQ